ncbi:hypothetical protein LWI29_010180 [Acer saccharum]|uniref:Cupin type-1 domain-containing protein n=1 Tax=Acer saccharum TaxID=4024 RepID=A0AA39W6X6_ACESA|nr:hypothetical protein LWI29_010180 [Acer saccharum]
MNITGPVDENFFTFIGMRSLTGAQLPENFKILKACITKFPTLIGQGVSLAFLQFPTSSLNPSCTHSPSAELLFLIEGSLEYNPDGKKPATAVSSFGNPNPGIVSLALNLFTIAIDDDI